MLGKLPCTQLEEKFLKNKWLKRILIVTMVILGICLIATSNFKEIIYSLREIKPSILFIIIFLQIITEILLIFQWYKISKLMGLPVNFFKMMIINAKGNIMDSVTPGAKVGGEFLRGLLFKEKLGYTTNQSISLIAIQKIISVGSLVTMGLLALLFTPKDLLFLNNKGLKYVLVTVLSILVLFFITLIIYPKKIVDLFNRKKSNNKWLNMIKKWTYEFSEHILKIQGNKKALVFQFTLSTLIWMIFPIKLIILVSTFGLKINILGLFATTLISYVIGMIPLLPGGLGSFEMTMSGLLIMMGLTTEQSLITSVTFRFVTFWFVVLLSLLVSAVGSIRERGKHEKEKTNKQMERTTT